MSNDKELLNLAYQLGWQKVRGGGSKHVVLRHPDGGMTTLSASGHGYDQNAKARLKHTTGGR